MLQTATLAKRPKTKIRYSVSTSATIVSQNNSDVNIFRIGKILLQCCRIRGILKAVENILIVEHITDAADMDAVRRGDGKAVRAIVDEKVSDNMMMLRIQSGKGDPMTEAQEILIHFLKRAGADWETAETVLIALQEPVEQVAMMEWLSKHRGATSDEILEEVRQIILVTNSRQKDLSEK